jgi:hypothetical protein
MNDSSHDSSHDSTDRLVADGTAVQAARHRSGVDRVVGQLASRPDAEVCAALERAAVAALRAVWRRGWLPDEAQWRIARDEPDLEHLVALAISADAAGWSGEPFHPRWRALLDELDLPHTEAAGWLYEDVWRRGRGWAATIEAALRLCGRLQWFVPLGLLVPPPGGADLPGAAAAAANALAWASHLGGGDDAVLRKVRQLLAHAESTTFPDEAEAFTAKAYELASRHAVDVASLWVRGGRVERPVTVRVRIDDPYETPKSHLLQVVAGSNRCRAVRHGGVGLTSVVGFPSDVLTTQMVFTSLLLQSQTELLDLARRSPPGSRQRSRGFRSSFLTGYAWRIAERLAAVSREVDDDVAAAPGAADSLPALADRASMVDEVFDAAFRPRTRPVRQVDPVGVASGAAAADRASLDRSCVGGQRGRLGAAG